MTATLSQEEKTRLVELIKEKEDRRVFNKLSWFEAYEWQQKLSNSSEANMQMLAMCANQIGKEQPVSEPVLTPSGWVKMGDISVGDYVVGSDGKPTKVTHIHPQGVRDVYELTFTDGATVRCGEEHLWAVKKHRKWETLSVKDMVEEFKPAIIPSRPVWEGSDEDVLVDPYLLGLLLGDGGLTCSVGITTADEEIAQYCRQLASEYNCELKEYAPIQYRFSSKERTSKGYCYNQLTDLLRELGVYGHKSYSKFVPREYFLISPEKRLELLRGLMDSDGTASKKGARLFGSVSKQLALDVQELARGLGIDASLNFKPRKSGNSWEVVLYKSPVSVFNLSRKKERENLGDKLNIRLVNISKLPYQEESQCITVEAVDSLYMTNDFILTHNSTAGAYITACHLTGLYPDWWVGHKYKEPIYAWAAGVSNDTTRDICQTELFGLAEDVEMWGSGMVPKECCPLSGATRRRGTTGNTYDSVMVQHHDPETGEPNGMSRIGFKSYEMGEEKFYGRPVDWIWLDEQPPSNIYTQCITRTVATNGRVLMTFTPEAGATPVVHQFMHDIQKGQFLLQASWDDAPHLDEATKQQLLAQYPPHERELRSKGIPVLGSGLVFPIPSDKLEVEGFDIPDSWPRVAAIDFGWDHPTAVVWIAYDREADTLYVYDTYARSKETAIIHAAAIKERPHYIPIVWPKDGLQSDKGSGVSLADQYRQQGLNMTANWFTNPPTAQNPKGDFSVEAGVNAM